MWLNSLILILRRHEKEKVIKTEIVAFWSIFKLLQFLKMLYIYVYKKGRRPSNLYAD